MTRDDRFIPVTPRLKLDADELSFSFIRAGGPGGQNVNKVATAVQLRFDAAHSPSLPEAVRRKLVALAGRRATADGVIVIAAHRHRTQEMNRKDAVDRLVDLIRAAAVVPKKRVPTRATKGSKERRIKSKKQRASVKQNRRVNVSWD